MAGGSCLCGDIVWHATGPYELMSHCHCSLCRKFHGSAFATYVATSSAGFRWLAGEDNVTRYSSSAKVERPFCARCGAAAPLHAGERVFVAAGCLDDDPGVRPELHLFVASKAPWYEIHDALPRYEAYPAQWGLAAVERHAAATDRSSGIRGSCLCGAVGWQASGPLEGIINCHCHRCRKGRSAAHASNLFCQARNFRFTTGEKHLVSYHVPKARRFTNVFCRHCGSVQPRVSGRHVTIPAGSIDGDPGIRPTAHIFVPFKAEWFEISDDLPQYDSYAPRNGP